MINNIVVPKVFRSDNGTEFINKCVQELLAKRGIRHQRMVPYTQQKKRDIRTVDELARSLIHAKGLNKKLWAEAVNTVVYVLNRSQSTSNKTCTCFWLRGFCTCCKRSSYKWDAKSKRGIFIGYDSNVKGYRVYFESENKRTLLRCCFR